MANNTRAVTYTPELRQDKTAVNTTMFMRVAAPGMPTRSSASANEESPDLNTVHGTMHRISAMDNT